MALHVSLTLDEIEQIVEALFEMRDNTGEEATPLEDRLDSLKLAEVRRREAKRKEIATQRRNA